MLNIYITGSAGLVASKVIEDLPKDWVLFTPEVDEVDITNYEVLQRYFADKKLDAIINFAAITDVDGAEKERGDEKGLCWRVNVNGAVNLAQLAKEKQTLMIQISTDFVFSGRSGPYSENSQLEKNESFFSWYALTKKEAEVRVREVYNESSLVRLSLPTGNFQNPKDNLTKLKNSIEKGYNLFADQLRTMTWIPDITEVLGLMVENHLEEKIFHVVTRDWASPFQFGEVIAEKLHLGQIKPGSIWEYMKKEGIAPRPIESTMLCEATQKELGLIFKTWQEVVNEFVKQNKIS
jgi:dTDP-4-dehydrorhamnose reductase